MGLSLVFNFVCFDSSQVVSETGVHLRHLHVTQPTSVYHTCFYAFGAVCNAQKAQPTRTERGDKRKEVGGLTAEHGSCNSSGDQVECAKSCMNHLVRDLSGSCPPTLLLYKLLDVGFGLFGITNGNLECISRADGHGLYLVLYWCALPLLCRVRE